MMNYYLLVTHLDRLGDHDGCSRVGFLDIHILFVIYRVKNLNIYKLSIEFWYSMNIHYILLFINL
jgi:hypothetical protein